MKRNKNMLRAAIWALCALAMTATGCMRDANELYATGQGSAGRMRLKLGVAGMDGFGTQTRAMAEMLPGEADVYDLTLLFFERSNDGSGTFVTSHTVVSDTPPTSAGATDGEPLGNDFELEINSSAGLSPDADYTILAVANMETILGEGVFAADIAGINTEAAMRDYIYDMPASPLKRYSLPMSGETVKAAGQELIELSLKRLAVRLDVQNTIEDQYLLTSVSVYGAARQTMPWSDGTIAGLPYSGASPLLTVTSSGTAPDAVIENGAVIGGIYAFENYQSNPDANPASTTSVVVGLTSVANGGSPLYYRIPIRPDDAAQAMMRNNVYRVSIRSVNDLGAASEAAALTETGKINATINNWDLDEEGLIVTDGRNTMAVPAKIMYFGPEAETRNYEVFTLGDGALSITRQAMPSGISVSLDGNTLKVTVSALPAGVSSRDGTFDLSFGSLQGTIQVIQAPSQSQFININRSTLPFYPAISASGISDGELLRVMSSAPWEATIYNPSADPQNPGFSFADGSKDLEIAPGDGIGSTPFDIFSTGSNTGNDTRYGFVIFRLAEYPQFSQVLVLRQAPMPHLEISPNYTLLSFDASGVPSSPLAPSGATDYTIEVSTGTDPFTGQPYDWTPSLDDDTHFTIQKIDDAHLRLTANETNLTPAILYASLSIAFDGADGAQTSLSIPITQEAFRFTVTRTSTLSTVPVTGTVLTGGVPTADYVEYTVDIPSSMKWSATVVTDTNAAAGDGRKLVHHQARLMDQNGNAIVPGQSYPPTTRIRVVYPKVYYPNRDIPISSEITVTVEGGSVKETNGQTMLATPTQFVAFGMDQYLPSGNLTDRSLQEQFFDKLTSISGYSLLADAANSLKSVTAVPDNVDYLNVLSPISSLESPGAYNWAAVKDFLDNHDGWTLIGGEWTEGPAVMNNPYSPTVRAGYPNMAFGADDAAVFASDTKVYHYLMDEGRTPITAPAAVGAFTDDGTANYFPMTGLPASAVVMMVQADNAAEASLIIDIENKFMFRGGCQLFDSDCTSAGNVAFLDNMIHFIDLASRFGSHFTDLLLEGDNGGVNPRVLPDGRTAQPAPWDTSYWGANAE